MFEATIVECDIIKEGQKGFLLAYKPIGALVIGGLFFCCLESHSLSDSE